MSIGLIVINGLDPLVLFPYVGSCYFFPGVYFGVSMPVDPMKVIGAYVIASGIAAPRIFAAILVKCRFFLPYRGFFK